MRQHCTRLTVMVALAFVQVAVARDVYVNNVAGNDANRGRRSESDAGDGPVKTLDRALRLVTRGGRIVLANSGEPYREMISLCDVEQRGYPDQPLVIVGNGATLDGTALTPPDDWHYETDNIFSFRPRRLAYQQLFRDGQPVKRAADARFAGAALPLETLEWGLLSDRIAFRVEQGKLPENYNLRHADLQTGITLYNTDYVRIENLVIQGFQQDGINAHELVRNCELVRVECRANGRSGISVGGVSRVAIVDSHCYDNGRTQLRVEEQGRVTAVRSDFGQKSANVPWLEIRGGQADIDGQVYR